MAGMENGKITSGGKERTKKAAEVLNPEFIDDPCIAYFMAFDREQRRAYLPTYMNSLVKAAGYNKATITEIDNWSSCAVWMPPGTTVANPLYYVQSGIIPLLCKLGYTGFSRMAHEFTGKSEAIKEKALKKGEKYHYLFFIATRSDRQGKGYASKLIQHYQTIAEKEGCSLWLEATTEKSMKLYLKLGFEIVGEILLGKGKAGADGMPKKDGEGVKIWGMRWRPGVGEK